MTNLYEIIEEMFGTAPNTSIETLYYVFGLIIMLYIFRIAFSFLKAVLGIHE